MAMFDKHKSSKQSSPVSKESAVSAPGPSLGAGASLSSAKVAMIGEGIIISGDVKANGNLKVEGRIEGRSIQCSQEIEIGEAGQVSANVMGKVVKVSGVVAGDIGGSEKVLISRTGRVQGNIIAPRVQLEDGALFRGSIDMTPVESAGAEKPAQVGQSAQAKAAGDSAQPKAGGASDSARKEPSLNLKSG